VETAGSTLTVAHITPHACIRAIKLALTSSDFGHKPILVAQNVIGNLHPWWAFPLVATWYRGVMEKESRLQFQDTIKSLDPLVDIWHIHNEPDWPVTIVDKLSDKPIIYDIHDMVSQRAGKPVEEEEEALSRCDGVSVVSRRYQEIVLPKIGNKPVHEILSGVPKEWMPKKRATLRRQGIVYEGGLASPGLAEFPCRMWNEVFNDLHKMGIQTWAYPGNPDVNRTFYPRTIILGPIEYVTLLSELTQYDFALIGSPIPDPMFDGSIPNKLFEYMAAGIPMICMNAPQVSEFLLATGMGVTVSDVSQIPQAMEMIQESGCAQRIWENRFAWSADRQMWSLLQLYEKVLHKEIRKPFLEDDRSILQIGPIGN
jgi:glycosyltransferase involved in cell wall biosynthesis